MWFCRRHAGIALSLVAFGLAPCVLVAQTRSPSAKLQPASLKAEAKTSIQAIVASGRLDNLEWPNFADYRAFVDALYRGAKYRPLWLQGGGAPTRQALQMIALLQQADADGLHADDYDGSRWPERVARLQHPHTASDEARFDVSLTVSAMRYVSDLRIGRVDPKYFKFALDVGPKELNLVQFFQRSVLSGTDLRTTIRNIEPPLSGYVRMREALHKYQQLAQTDDGEKLPEARGIVFSGTPYAGVPRLTKLLRMLGDLPEGATLPADPQMYDGALVEAVKRFQTRHGLRPDGYLDVDTIAQLNVPISDRVVQIRLALERYRWLRYDFPQPPVIVNIPEFRLYALDKDGKVGLTMTVDVGQEYKNTRTPVLESNIEYLVFRPYWDVPFDIQRDEVLPEARKDPKYLADNHFEIVALNGKVVVADGKASKEILDQVRTGRLRIRQRPGPDNSLGLVKFIFPNRYSVYLHDIPSWGDYFADPDRNVSHGCVHVKDPAQLAAWMLRDKPEWSSEKVQRAMQQGQDNLRVNLTKPLPILFVYMTAVVHEHGEIYFYRDIYGYDSELQDALSRGHSNP